MKVAQLTARSKSMITVIGLLILAAALGWFATRPSRPDRRVYRIGFDNQPPQHFIGNDGKPTGLAVELIDEAARRHGIRLQWLLAPESAEAALRSKKVDLWPMMTIRPERKKIVYITDPYREDAFCFIVRSGSTATRLED